MNADEDKKKTAMLECSMPFLIREYLRLSAPNFLALAA